MYVFVLFEQYTFKLMPLFQCICLFLRPLIKEESKIFPVLLCLYLLIEHKTGIKSESSILNVIWINVKLIQYLCCVTELVQGEWNSVMVYINLWEETPLTDIYVLFPSYWPLTTSTSSPPTIMTLRRWWANLNLIISISCL